MTYERSLADQRSWTQAGTGVLESVLADFDDEELDEPSLLPGWSRRYLLGHVAGNAIALNNLTVWARTGIETPMYESPEQREHDIAHYASLDGAALRKLVRETAAVLESGMDQLTAEQWECPVRTAQGRQLAADQIPWLRAREVMLHAVDLNGAASLSDLPPAFLGALIADIVTKRASDANCPALTLVGADGTTWSLPGEGVPVIVEGELSALVAYLAGRAFVGELISSAGDVPELPRWL